MPWDHPLKEMSTMQRTRRSAPVMAAVALVGAVLTTSCAANSGQGQSGAPAAAAPAQTAAAPAPTETSRAVAGGGVSIAGWTGKIDDNEVAAGQTLSNARLAMEGNVMHVTTGPATAYWNPANRATGDYTVSATFTEPKYMNLNAHPHPYGLFIAGNDLGTAQQSYLYCAAYGNGNVIVRGFGPATFQMNGPRGEANAAVHKAAGPGEPVSQDIALRVGGDKVECLVNGAVVGSYDKAALVTAGKLKSTDGIYGIRFGHNTDATVSNLRVTRP
jgi:hypothetical protein